MNTHPKAAIADDFSDHEFIGRVTTHAEATRMALQEIDGEIKAMALSMASLRSRELLLQAARQEVLQRDRAAEAVAKCLEAVQEASHNDAEDKQIFDAASMSIMERHLEDLVEGILSVSDRIAA